MPVKEMLLGWEVILLGSVLEDKWDRIFAPDICELRHWTGDVRKRDRKLVWRDQVETE